MPYGDLTAKGDPRFIEPLITTGLDNNNMPINNVVKFVENQDPIYFFVICDNFKEGDDVTVTWMYSSDTSKEVAKVINKTADDYGRFIITFQKPDGGWNEGTNMIQVTSTDGTQKTIVFTVGGNSVETQKLTCSDSTTGSASQSSASTGTSCRPSCNLGTKCNDEQDCASGFCVQGVCSAAPVAASTSGLTYRPTITHKKVVIDTRLSTYSTTVTPTITPSCPASIWGSKWGTKWNSYENGDTIVDLWSGADNWDDYVTTPVTMTQNCWGVTGTIEFQPDCIGTITGGAIDKNDPNHLTKGWVTTGCEAEDSEGYTPQFSVNMDNNKHGWIGKLISVNDPFADRDYQDNWAGRRV